MTDFSVRLADGGDSLQSDLAIAYYGKGNTRPIVTFAD